jgi:hypothetical protein
MRFWLEDSLSQLQFFGLPGFVDEVFVRVDSISEVKQLLSVKDDRAHPWPLPYGYISPRNLDRYSRFLMKLAKNSSITKLALDIEFIFPLHRTHFKNLLTSLVDQLKQHIEVLITINPLQRNYRIIRDLEAERNIMLYLSPLLKMGRPGQRAHDAIFKKAARFFFRRGFTLSLGLFYHGRVLPTLSKYFIYPSYETLLEFPLVPLKNPIIFSLDPFFHYHSGKRIEKVQFSNPSY